MKPPRLAAILMAAAALVAALAAGLTRHGRGASSSTALGSASPEAAAAVVRATGPGRPVLFVGLDGADWQLLDRYVAAGSMPNLARLVREGAGGTLRTIHPPLSPLVWTTMMTGVSPLQHGILDFTRWSPVDGRKEPVTSDERRVPAIWNMASDGGRRVAVFGLWATYPAETVRGLMVSDRLTGRSASRPSGPIFPG